MVEFALNNIATHPEVQTRLVQEMFKEIPKGKAVIKENLR